MNAMTNLLAKFKADARSTSILTGRSIYDVDLHKDGSITTLVHLLAEAARDTQNMVMLRYSLSSGLVVPFDMYDKVDADTIKQLLKKNGITEAKCATGNCSTQQELADILRGVIKLSSSNNEAKWRNGSPIRVMLLLEFSSDILQTPASAKQYEIRELIYTIMCSRSFQNKGHLLLITDVVDGKVDPQLQGALYNHFMPFPTHSEKLRFIAGLLQKYPNATYEEGLNHDQVANLSNSSPNRGLEMLFKSSHHSGCPIDSNMLTTQRAKEIEEISEGTMSLLDTARVKGVSLKGDNVRIPLDFLIQQATALRERKSAATNILLAGSPGTGKTDLANIVALCAQIPVYQLNSPKGSLVGETERKARLQAQLFTNSSPIIGYIDEITEATQVNRGNSNLDSGASDSVMKELLGMLSDKSRESRSLLIASTNLPLKMGAAMRDRFIVVPVIMPAVDDYPEIIAEVARQVADVRINPQSNLVVNAASIFYGKHAMPRRIRAALKMHYQLSGTLTEETILEAANDIMPLDNESWSAAIVSDLSAIECCISKKLLPWYGRETTYKYPDYIKAILDENYGVDAVKLRESLNNLKNVNI